MESESSGGRTTGIQLVASIVVPGLVLFGPVLLAAAKVSPSSCSFSNHRFYRTLPVVIGTTPSIFSGDSFSL